MSLEPDLRVALERLCGPKTASYHDRTELSLLLLRAFYKKLAFFLVMSAALLCATASAATPSTSKVNDRWPAFSPDSHSIAFERSRGTSMDIYVVNVDGGEARRVTSGPPGVLSMAPAWFPNGGHLLYTTSDASSMYPSGAFYEIPSGGGDARSLGPAGERGRSISPDGSAVLYLTRNWEVAELDLATGTRTVLSHPAPGTWDTEATWSPDGKSIAFGCNYSPSAKVGRSDICIMNADGSGRRVVFPRSDAVEWVTWSPDGRFIAFQADSKNFTAGSIVVGNVENGRVDDISGATGFALNETPAWSPDGRWIAFQVKTDDGYRIALMHPDGSSFHRIT
jgi:Tol biopolymer transport system component